MKKTTRYFLLLALLAVLAAPLDAVSLNETFEGWAWHSTPNGYCAFGADCFNVMGCGNGKPLFIRRVVDISNQSCAYYQEVWQWTGGETVFHGNDSAVSGTKVAAMVPSFADDGALELLTSRDLQAGPNGSAQVDFYLHGRGMLGGEHVGLLHNLRFVELAGCSPDCATVPFTRTTTNAGPGFDFYGVIAGNFGEGSAAVPFGSHGFVVERACTPPVGDTDGSLIDSTFIPVSGGLAANTWYRIAIWRMHEQEPGLPPLHYYGYTAYQRAGASWQEIGSRTIPTSKLLCSGGTLLPNGYIGFSALPDLGQPPGTPDGGIFHVDFDNLIVDW
jgi:hypothetical protein